jgi:hypothetical protein
MRAMGPTPEAVGKVGVHIILHTKQSKVLISMEAVYTYVIKPSGCRVRFYQQSV